MNRSFLCTHDTGRRSLTAFSPRPIVEAREKKHSNAFSTHPETPAPRTHFPQNPLGDIRADPSARASHRTQGRPCPTSQSLRSGFEPASTGVPRFRAHHRHFTNRSATKPSDAMLLKKKGHESLCPIILSCPRMKRHMRDTFRRLEIILTTATMEIHGKHHDLSSQQSRQY
jgi:hypothetical protein